MKRTFRMNVVFAVVLALLLAVGASAAFEKTETYTPGQFTDVPLNEWYASDVATAYELGFIKGDTATTMNPNGQVTVAEAITMVDRIHAIYNGTTAPGNAASGKWYDNFVKYAKDNGIITDDTFNSYDRPILRYEVASLFAKALPDDYYAAKNNVTAIPDVDPAEEYADDLLKLYKAGVVMGSDAYGDFLPNTLIKRSEAAAIINRVALPENRLSRTLSAVPEKNEAYYIIDDYELTRYTPITAGNELTSSWNYDSRSSSSVNTTGVVTSSLVDTSDEGYTAMNRNIEVQTKGTMLLTTTVNLGVGLSDGARIYFSDSDDNTVLEFATVEGKWTVNSVDTGIVADEGKVGIIATIDLDNKNGTLSVNGTTASYTFDDFKDFAKLTYSTSEKGIGTFTPSTCHLSVNYAINETFDVGFAQDGWDMSEAEIFNFVGVSAYEANVLKFVSSGYAAHSFKPVTGKFAFETYAYFPYSSDTASITLSGSGAEALKISIAKGNITCGSAKKAYKDDLWYIIHVEADTDTGDATIFINGKVVGHASLSASSIDTVTFDYDGDGDGYFDSIKLYNIYDYENYVPTVNKVETPGYCLIMSVCSLWREGTHYGWDAISPYEESSPLLGYYDEGLPEASDWNVKYMAEHGVSAQQYCWYSPISRDFNGKPIEYPRLYWDLHDGYFYGKYSDEVKFCLLWENANFASASMTLDQFKTYLWDYWVEYYFTDPRYLTIDNQVIMEIYRVEAFTTTFGEVGGKAVLDFMREDIKNYGFDGMVILFSDEAHSGNNIEKLKSIGADGVMPYGWNSASYDPEYIKGAFSTSISNLARESSLTFIPTAGNGRNMLGWGEKRTPLSTPDQYAVTLQYTKDALAAQNKGGSWRKQLVYLSTWNEYGEGHWIAPTGLNGFGYVDEYVKAYAPGTPDHADVVPTIVQKNRISHLYNDTRTPIRRLWLETKDEDTIPEDLIFGFDYSADAVIDNYSRDRISTFELRNGALHYVASQRDPIFRYERDIDLNAEDVALIHVRMKSTVNTSSNIFFTTASDSTWTASKCVSTNVSATSGYKDYYYDTAGCDTWKGVIKRLRLDLIEELGEADIECIEFLGYTDAQKPLPILVDGVALQIPKEYQEKENGEFLVAGDRYTGIYTALNLYHEWNRFTGKLLLKTENDKTIVFTVGSDNALVDGTEKKLKGEFRLYDGMPLLPMLFICDQCGFDYTLDDELRIDVRGIDFGEIIRNRNDHEWEFNIDSDAEEWVANNVSLTIVAGDAVLIPTAAPSSWTGYDPGINLLNLALKASDYIGADIRIRYAFEENATDRFDETVTIYFATNKDTSLNEAKTLKLKLSDGVADGDGYYVFHFDATKQELWRDTITRLRFDPTNNNGRYEIDYIRLIPGTNNQTKKTEFNGPAEDLNPYIDETPVYQLNFDKANEMDNLSGGHVKLEVVKGELIMTSDEGNNDPIISFKKMPEELNDASKFDKVVVRFKVDATDFTSTCYYMLDDMPSFSAAYGASTTPNSSMRDGAGYYTVVIDLAKKNNWSGQVTGFRFDPADIESEYNVDYIKFYLMEPNKGAEAEARAAEIAAKADVNAAKTADKYEDKDPVFAINFDGSANDAVVTGSHGTLSSINGHGIFVSEQDDNDPQIQMASPLPSEINSAAKFDTMVVRFKVDGSFSAASTCFFKVNGMPSFDGEHSATAFASSENVDEDGYMTIAIDLNQKGNWSGSVDGIRFDPADIENVYYIDYIAFYKLK